MKDTGSSDALLFAEERSQAAAELSAALQQLPAAARRAVNPIHWFRRHPVAASAVVALGALAVYGQIRAARRPPTARSNSWLHRLSLDLLGALRRSLTAALTARLAWRGVAASAPSANGPWTNRTVTPQNSGESFN